MCILCEFGSIYQTHYLWRWTTSRPWENKYHHRNAYPDKCDKIEKISKGDIFLLTLFQKNCHKGYPNVQTFEGHTLLVG
jgi:hypothetical protein